MAAKTTRIQLSNIEWDRILYKLSQNPSFQDYSISEKISKSTGRNSSSLAETSENNELEMYFKLYLENPISVSQDIKAKLYTYSLERSITLTESQENDLNEAYMAVQFAV